MFMLIGKTNKKYNLWQEVIFMPLIMVVYYAISIYLIGMLIWNFVREKKSTNDMLLYLIVAVPLVLRVLRIK